MMTETTSTGTTATAANPFQQAEAFLSAEGAAAMAWVKNAFLNAGAFVEKAASDAEVGIDDFIQAIETLGAHMGIVESFVTVASGSVSVLPEADQAEATKVLSDINNEATEVTALGQALQRGVTLNTPPAVATAVTAITGAQKLVALAATVASAISSATSASPTATQVVTPASPAPPA